MIYATRALIEVLVELAANRDPESVTVPLAVTPASTLGGLELNPDTPVFSHFYLPDAGQAVTAVFGVDLGTPSGQTPGMFVSHPDGIPRLKQTDDLREVVLIAVPPWEAEAIQAFGRDGRRRQLTVVPAVPPHESLP